jgi:hypothetical protein
MRRVGFWLMLLVFLPVGFDPLIGMLGTMV